MVAVLYHFTEEEPGRAMATKAFGMAPDAVTPKATLWRVCGGSA